MHQSATLVVISDQSLPKAPKVLQDYVREFFKRTEVLGKDCWVAFIDSLRTESNSTSNKNCGVAHYNWYGNLWADLDELCASNSEECFKFSASWEDACSGPPIQVD